MDAQFRGAITAIKQDFDIEIAETSHQILEAQRLRYQVFCEERSIFSGQDQIERDEYDDHSHHIVIRRRRCDQLVGTVRLVTTSQGGRAGHFPMSRVAGAAFFRQIPVGTTGEISRFALSKTRRDMTSVGDIFVRLGLLQGLVRASRMLGLTHWCAAMEPSLLRLLRSASIHFTPVGPLVEYRGLRQPVIGCIDDMLERGRWERPELWEFVTECNYLHLAASTSSRRQQVAA